MARSHRGAPDVSVDTARGVVTISGKVAWEGMQGRLDAVRQTTAYRIEIPLEDSPFESGFAPPPKGTFERLGRDGALRFGEPLDRRGVEQADDQPVGLYRLTKRAAPEFFGTEVMAVKGPQGDLSIKGIEGAFKSAAVIGFNAKMTAVTDVAIVFRAQFEDSDGHTRKGVLLGVDEWTGGLKVSGAAGGGGAGGEVGGVPGSLAAETSGARADESLRGAHAGDSAGDRAQPGRGGDNDLRGGPGTDRLRGGRGDDDLHGGRGADRLHDGAGEDRLTGGRGADVFVMSHDGDSDAIMDFDPGRDVIDLTAFGPGLEFEDLEVSARDGAVILLLDGEALEIRGAEGDLRPEDLSAGDFLFA